LLSTLVKKRRTNSYTRTLMTRHFPPHDKTKAIAKKRPVPFQSRKGRGGSEEKTFAQTVSASSIITLRGRRKTRGSGTSAEFPYGKKKGVGVPEGEKPQKKSGGKSANIHFNTAPIK